MKGMVKNMKKLFASLLALVLLLSLVPFGAMAEEEPLEIKWLVYNQLGGLLPNPDSEVKQLLEEKYNVTITIEQADIHNAEQMSLYWASSPSPDYVSFSSGVARTFYDLYDQGFFRSIPEGWLDTYMPDYMAILYDQFGEDEVKKQIKINGEDAYVPYSYEEWPYIMGIRQDWLDNLGLEMPTNNDELFDVLYAFTFNDPDGNGADDTYGIHPCAGNWVSKGFGNASAAYGITPDSYWLQDDGSVIYTGVTDQYKEMLRMLNEWYAAGVVDPEFTTDDRSAERDKLFNSKVGVVTDDSNWWMPIAGKLPEMIQAVSPEARISYIPPFEAPDGKRYVVWYMPSMLGDGSGAFGESCSDEVMQKVMQIKNDFAADWDFYLRCGYGVEGQDYELIDGIVNVINNSGDPAYRTEKGLGPTFCLAPVSNENFKYNYPAEGVEVYNFSNSFDKLRSGQNFVLPETPQVARDHRADVSTIASEFYYNAITGQADIDADWDGYVASLEAAGLNDIIAAYEDALK